MKDRRHRNERRLLNEARQETNLFRDLARELGRVPSPREVDWASRALALLMRKR